jgi:hypothetical protein
MKPRRKRPAIAARDGVERLAALSRDVEAAVSTLQEATDLAARAEDIGRDRDRTFAEAESQEAEHRRKARADAEGRAATLTSEVRR